MPSSFHSLFATAVHDQQEIELPPQMFRDGQSLYNAAVLAEGGVEHVGLVRKYASIMGSAYRGNDDWVKSFEEASVYHDIGMLGVPDRILQKKGKLTDEERMVVQRHTHVPDLIGIDFREPYTKDLVNDVIRHHHDRVGNGKSPEGNLMSIVDAYDALTMDRSWRKKMTPQQAAEVIRKEAGTKFDPKLVEIFTNVLPQLAQATESYQLKVQDRPLAEKFRLGMLSVYHMEGSELVFEPEFLKLIQKLPPDRQDRLKQYALKNDPVLLSTALRYADDPSISLPPVQLSKKAQAFHAEMQRKEVAELNNYTQEEPEEESVHIYAARAENRLQEVACNEETETMEQ